MSRTQKGRRSWASDWERQQEQWDEERTQRTRIDAIKREREAARRIVEVRRRGYKQEEF